MKSLAAALAISVMTGCVVGEDMPTQDDLPPPQSEAAYANNPRTAFNFFVAQGLTEIQAAGIVGNLMQESSVLPTAVELGGGPGRGIAQWSIGGRWNSGSNSVASYAAKHGADRWALQTQLDFVWYELSVVGGYGLPSLRSATTLSQAVTVFQNSYELCGACAQSKRLVYAQQVLADYGGSGGTGSDPGPGCYSGTLERDMPENTCVESKYDGQWYQCSDGQWVDRWSDPDPCTGIYPL